MLSSFALPLRSLLLTRLPLSSPSMAALSTQVLSLQSSPFWNPLSPPSASPYSTSPPVPNVTTAIPDPTQTSSTDTPTPPGSTPAESTPPPPSGPPKLLVFGGRGFVGSSVCKAAIASGLHVVSISRSGTPPLDKSAWTSQVEWVRGNGLEPQTFAHLLPGAAAVISCIGGFSSSQDAMLRVNGTANATVFRQAAQAGVERAVFISAHVPNIPGIGNVLKGYIEGKKLAEQALWEAFPQGGVALRPGMIYGTRTISGTIQLPLQWVGVPVKTALSYVPNRQQLQNVPLLGAFLVPPVSVEAVGKAAVRAATDPAIKSRTLEVDDIAQYE